MILALNLCAQLTEQIDLFVSYVHHLNPIKKRKKTIEKNVLLFKKIYIYTYYVAQKAAITIYL